MKYMGIDLHKQYFVATVMDEGGGVLRRDRVSTDRSAIGHYFGEVGPANEIAAVMEACYGWEYFYDEVKGLVGDLRMAHPLKTRLIAEARIKTDSIDSEVLAHLLRADLVAEAYAPPFETRDQKNLMRFRASLSRFKVMVKNMVHAVLARNHVEDEALRSLSDKFGKGGRAIMRQLTLRGNDTGILGHYLDLLEDLEARQRAVEKGIRAIYMEDEVCGLLGTVPGIGPILSVLIRHEIDDIGRFSSPSRLCSYAGLVPGTYSSGGRTFQGRITKQGNRWLRWAMVEAAQRIPLHDPQMGGIYRRIKAKSGSKVARVAVARRLLGIIYRIWKDKRPYYKKL